MDPLYLLQRMASISPGALLKITGRTYLINIDEDEIDHRLMINECLAEIINEAYEIGIEFHCTLGDLAESLYTIDKTLLLFEVVFPTPLYRSITESDAFKTMISSIVLDNASFNDETSIETILEQLAIYDESTAPIFYETYQFLQDKIKSTPVFDAYVKSILDVNNTPFEVEVDNNEVQLYLTSIQDTIRKLLKAADVLRSNLSDNNTLYEDINDYKIKATDLSTLEIYTWAFNTKNQDNLLPVAQALIEKYRLQFSASVPFYDEYYILAGNTVTMDNIPSLILGVFLDAKTKEAFLENASDVFKKLQAHNQIITNDMMIKIQNLSLAIVQEYYK